MAQSDTVVRILDTAEALFAEKGFAETSLRAITSRAKVNLAAVNYHFGSKKALIQAVFARYLDPFCEEFNKELASLEKKSEVSLEELLEVLARCTVNVPATKGSLSVFMRLLGLAYTQAQGHMRRYLQEHYGQTFLRFTNLLKLSSADLPDAERFWRIHFMLGAVVFTMSSLDALRDIALSDYNEKTRIADLVARLLPVVTAAMHTDRFTTEVVLPTPPF